MRILVAALLLSTTAAAWTSTASAQEPEASPSVDASENLDPPESPVPLVVMPEPQLRHAGVFFYTGVPLAAGGIVFLSEGGWMVSLRCEPGDVCLLSPAIVLFVFGGALTLIASILLTVGAMQWADVDRENDRRRRATPVSLRLDARGVGIQW